MDASNETRKTDDKPKTFGFTSWFKKLGPGLITGAADDDPSGIATYSQAGAKFGYNMLWTVFLTYPLMVAIQVISAKIGCVSGKGLATNIREHYPRPLLFAIVTLLLGANTINIAADVAAMGGALNLLIGGPAQIYALCFGILSLVLQICVPYSRYVTVLKWLTLSLLAYVLTVFVVDVPWSTLVQKTLLPQLSSKPEFITMVVAVFGTTISPYLFFWQASQEVEDQEADPLLRPLLDAPELVAENFQRIKTDTLAGMGFSNLVAFFIMLTAAVALNAHGITDIQTSSQAASALKPIAGKFASWVFAAGIVGTGLLAVPVLAGSAAYAIAGAFRWKSSMELKPSAARKFYLIIGGATLLGTALCFTPIDPIKALYWSAVVNGVVSVPIMVIMMMMASSSKVMGKLTVSKRLSTAGWLCTLAMAIAVVAMFCTL